MKYKESALTLSQAKRLEVIKFSMIITFVSFLGYLLLYIFYDFDQFLPAIVSISVFLLFNSVSYALLLFDKHSFGLHLFSITLFYEMVFLTFYLFGKSPGLHFYFVLFMVALVLVFPVKQIKVIFFYFLQNVAAFLYVEFFNPEGIIEYPHSLILPVKLVTVVMTLGTTMTILILYHSRSEKQENELHNAKGKLEEANSELETINNELQESYSEIAVQKQNLLEINKSLEEANHTKNLFFSIISHDLKNPLSAFVGLVEFLQPRIYKFEKEKIKKFMDAIADSAISLQKLVIDLLEWSRTQTNSIKLELVPCSVKELLEENQVLCRELAQQKSVFFSLFMTEDVIIKTDRSLLGTVLRNLFTNAIKYSYTGGEVKIYVHKVDDFLYVTIKDNGVGMSAEKAKKLFEIDKVESTAGTNEETGTGLGLIISYEFVKILNGSITVKSNEEQGSEFVIALPV